MQFLSNISKEHVNFIQQAKEQTQAPVVLESSANVYDDHSMLYAIEEKYDLVLFWKAFEQLRQQSCHCSICLMIKYRGLQ